MEIEVAVPRWAEPLLAPARYKGAYGGRGSGKSHFFAESLVVDMVADPNLRAVCIREVQKSLKFSSKQLLEDKIEQLGVGHLFEIQKEQINRIGGAGLCIFQGMQDHTAESIKSLEGFQRAWVEEARNLSARSLKMLRPTMRAPGAEMWFSWNPDQPDDPVEFLRTDPPPGAIVVGVNYEDNPFFPDDLVEELKYDMRGDPITFDHVWRGAFNVKSSQIVFAGCYRVEEFTPAANWDGPYFGADFGFAQDPTTLIKVWLHADQIWIEKESGKVGLDIDRTGAQWLRDIPEAAQHVIRADSARPETISYLRRHGFTRIVGVDKWPGSVEDGVEWMRARKIVVHPRCVETAKELRLYRYKTNTAGDVLPQIVDANNHRIDAARYAVAPLIKRRGATVTELVL